jgi:hypothetical protein
MGRLTNRAIQGLINEDLESLKHTVKSYKKSLENLEDWNGQLYQEIKNNRNITNGHLKDHIRCYDLQQDMMQSLSWVVKQCAKHVKNSHEPPSGLITRRLNRVIKRFLDYQRFLLKQLKGSKRNAPLKMARKELQSFLNDVLESHISTVQKDQVDDIIGKMLIGLILEIKDMAAISERMVLLAQENKKVRSKQLEHSMN